MDRAVGVSPRVKLDISPLGGLLQVEIQHSGDGIGTVLGPGAIAQHLHGPQRDDRNGGEIGAVRVPTVTISSMIWVPSGCWATDPVGVAKPRNAHAGIAQSVAAAENLSVERCPVHLASAALSWLHVATVRPAKLQRHRKENDNTPGDPPLEAAIHHSGWVIGLCRTQCVPHAPR